MAQNPWQTTGSAYEKPFTELYLPDEEYEVFNLSMPDDRLKKLLIDSLDRNVAHWNQAPWRLQETDEQNVKFFLGDQRGKSLLTKALMDAEDDYTDNRLFDSIRAILSYATGQLGMPEITPSKSDESYLKMARAIQMALYQHSLNEQTEDKFRAALLNLLLRKRAYLKLRFDPHQGMYGDIVTEVCNPEDIIIDREAKYKQNPPAIYHRIRKTVDEWCAEFPKKANDIYRMFNIKRGTPGQLSRIVNGFECWFTYRDAKGIPREGLAWFFHDPEPLILDKVPNPNWVYTGNDLKDKETNVLFVPPKPFIGFNYLNLGHSYIDETTLFDQAKPLQKILNKRQKQVNENADYVNGRWVGSKKALTEEDGAKMINRGSKTMTLVNAEDVGKAVQVLNPQQLPTWVVETIQDCRNEIDTIMGTPSIFKGANPQNKDTLGRDMMLKQQAGALQDDLVRSVQYAYQDYYQIKLQMMRTYFTEDYWFQVKGGDGKFDFVMLNGDTIDTNVRIGVEVDSTLPLDKAMIRMNAKELLQANKIDYLTAMEDMGLPDPDIRTERYLRSQIDAYTYMQSIETRLDSNDAEVDIMMLKANRTPEERADYDENYLNFFNHFITTNEFRMLPQPVQQRMAIFLQEVTERAQRSASLNESTLNDAGIINRPPIMPLPRRTENIRLNAALDPQDSHNLAQGEAQLAVPANQLEQAQDPNQGGSPLPNL
jgi:hypothetical protein